MSLSSLSSSIIKERKILGLAKTVFNFHFILRGQFCVTKEKRENELKLNSSAPPTPEILLTHSKHTHTHMHTRVYTHTHTHARVQTNLFELLNDIIKY